MSGRFLRIDEHGVPVLWVLDALGRSETLAFQKVLQDLVRETIDTCVVDLVHCPYVTSRIFPMLLHANLLLEGRGKRLLIASRGEVRRCFRLLRLDDRLTLLADREACLDRIRAGWEKDDESTEEAPPLLRARLG